MKLKDLKNDKVVFFAAGIASVFAAKKLVKSEKVRKACVSGIAKGMKLQQDAQETFKNMKEDAEDLCYEARTSLDNEEVEINEI